MGDYVVTSDVIEYGGFGSSDDDVLIGRLIDRAEQFIDTYTGRRFQVDSDDEVARNFTASIDVEGPTLFLDDDLNTIVSIVAGTDTLAATDYVTEPRNDTPYWGITLKEQSSEVWTNANSDGDFEDVISVTAQWAYSSSAPLDIQHAALRLVKWYYDQRQTDADLDRPLLTSQGVTILPSTVPRDVTEILDRYKDKGAMA